MATWTAGSTRTTGDIVTAAQWNTYLGASGSLDYLKDAPTFSSVTTTGNISVAGQFLVQGTGPHVLGGSVSSNVQFSVVGTFTCPAATESVGFLVNSVLTLAASTSSSIAKIVGTFTEAASGTHTLLAGLNVTAPTITSGVATVTNTASLYVSDAPTCTVTGANYAVWVDAGVSRFDGAVTLGAAMATGVGAFHVAGTVAGDVSATYGIYFNPTLTVATGASAAVLLVQGTITEFSSGVHGLLAGTRINAPAITVGAATVTNTATLYIDAAPTATVTGQNYAIFVDSGLTRFDGNGTHVFEFPANAVDPTGGGGAAAGRVPLLVGGALRHLAYY